MGQVYELLVNTALPSNKTQNIQRSPSMMSSSGVYSSFTFAPSRMEFTNQKSLLAIMPHNIVDTIFSSFQGNRARDLIEDLIPIEWGKCLANSLTQNNHN